MRKTAIAFTAILLFVSAVLLLANFPRQHLDPHSKADRIVVLKAAHTLTLYAGDRPLITYKVALGKGGGNAKQQRGDHETPEGNYFIDGRNAQSRFHLALHISYPSAVDKARARQQGVNTGTDIMIHGVEPKFRLLGELQHQVDWTDGCIAVTDSEMDDIWKAVPTGTPIEIHH